MQYRKFKATAMAMSKLSKMLDENTILRIRGSCDCDGGEIGWQKSKIAAEKIENVSSIFSAAIFVTQFPPSQSQDPRIRDIASLFNIFEN